MRRSAPLLCRRRNAEAAPPGNRTGTLRATVFLMLLAVSIGEKLNEFATRAGLLLPGFLGFGLASMPVAMATMEKVGRRYGPSPRASLLITMAGSFFVDRANAFVGKSFLALPWFAIP